MMALALADDMHLHQDSRKGLPTHPRQTHPALCHRDILDENMSGIPPCIISRVWTRYGTFYFGCSDFFNHYSRIAVFDPDSRICVGAQPYVRESWVGAWVHWHVG
jgi:hypothetical protein